jgi:glutathione peroxidase
MRGILVITALICCIKLSAQSTVYSFQLDSIAGSAAINFSAFTGKKILIVNTASLDSNAVQYSELKSLKQLFGDSLVIVAVPSNDFGTEPGPNSEIDSVYTQTSTRRFPVSAKISVTGTNTHPLYQWLTQQSLNGVTNSTINKAFFKYLIGKSGTLVAVFHPMVRPLDILIREAIAR